MPTPTYIPLQTITLGSSASSVTFASIPQTYRDLVLVATPISSLTTDVDFRFNGDTGSNYSIVQASGDGSSTYSPSGTTTTLRPTYYGGPGTSVGSVLTLQLMDYSATDKHKTTLGRASRAAAGVEMNAGRWANTEAITSIVMFSLSGKTWSAGTVVSLYGIEA